MVVGGKKYNKPFVGHGSLQHGTTGASTNQEDEWRGLSFIVPPEDKRWLEQCYVGILHSVKDVSMMLKHMYEEGLFSVSVRSMGWLYGPSFI